MENELQELLVNTQKEYTKSNKTKDKVIVLLIVLMFLQAIVCYSGFVYYTTQFEEVETTTETKEVDLDTSGNSSNIEYNDNNVSGNQYNGNSTHNE